MKRTIINPVIKDTVTFIQTSAESQGKVSELIISLSVGGSNTLHYHKTYTETFTALEGDLGVKLGKKTLILKPGQKCTVPINTLHHFFNPGDKEIKFRTEIEPGHEGFENSLRILYGLAADGLSNHKSIPKSLTHTAIIVCMSDMNAPGMLTILYPVLKWLAKRAKRNGEEQRLIDKYCV